MVFDGSLTPTLGSPPAMMEFFLLRVLPVAVQLARIGVLEGMPALSASWLSISCRPLRAPP